MDIAILQHVDFEGPAEIENWCRQTGNEYKVYRLFLGEALPKAERTDFLVILGGPMSVLDELPWLEEERQLIRVLISQGKPVKTQVRLHSKVVHAVAASSSSAPGQPQRKRRNA